MDIYITDSVDVEIPQNLNVRDEKSHEFKSISIKDNINTFSTDNLRGKVLEITVDASHCGYFNNNGYFYRKTGMAASAGTFLEPFPKPILTEHDGSKKPIGRTTAAAFISIPRGTFDMSAADAKLRGRPTGKIRLKALVTDPEAIKDVLTKRYMTVSTGGRPNVVPVCSACGEPVTMGFMGPELTCEHQINSYDEDAGTWVGMYVEGMDYAEWSFVNHPADSTPEHAAGVVSMALVSESEIEEQIRFDDVDLDGHFIFDSTQGNKKDKKEDGDMAIDSKLLEKAKELDIDVSDDMTEEDLKTLIAQKEKDAEDSGNDDPSETNDNNDNEVPFEDLVSQALQVLDECENCDDDISPFWEDATEEELEAIGKMDQLYEDFINMSHEDALSKEKRKKLPDSAFCGPDRTFPVDTCDRGATALAMLNWPNVKKEYSSSVRSKIKACVMRKGKSMGCSFAKKKKDNGDSAEDQEKTLLQQVEEQLQTVQESNDALTQEISGIKDKLNRRNDDVQASDKEIVELKAEIKALKAEKIIDLSLVSSRSMVSDLMQAEDKEAFETEYKKLRDELMTRTDSSLDDSISDLNKDVDWNSIQDRVDDPTTDGPAETGDDVDPIQEIQDKKRHEKANNDERVNKLLGQGYTNDKEDK